MAKILSPNKKYNGVSASVRFCNGVGETNDKHLIKWFQEHGYEVEELEESKEPEKAGAEVDCKEPEEEKKTAKSKKTAKE